MIGNAYWFKLGEMAGCMEKMLSQCIPVVSKDLFHSVRKQSLNMMGLHPNLPTLPMLRPFVDEAPGSFPIFTPMRKQTDWALALFLPPKQSFFVLHSGALVYNLHPKVKACPSDGIEDSCRIWKGTVLGVERTDTDWFVVDAYVVEGVSLLGLNFEQRRKRFADAKRCMPDLHFADDLPEPQGHRLWNPDTCLK
jgi:hypothetical protein